MQITIDPPPTGGGFPLSGEIGTFTFDAEGMAFEQATSIRIHGTRVANELFAPALPRTLQHLKVHLESPALIAFLQNLSCATVDVSRAPPASPRAGTTRSWRRWIWMRTPNSAARPI